MKISILYQSRLGTTEIIANTIKKGAESVEGVDEVKCMRIQEIDADFLNESDAVIFGTPTYLANTTWELKRWFDEEAKPYKLSGKLGAVFATSDYICGGADVAIHTIVGHMMVKGMMVYSGGSSLGKPYMHLGYVFCKEGPAELENDAELFGKRVAEQAVKIYK